MNKYSRHGSVEVWMSYGTLPELQAFPRSKERGSFGFCAALRGFDWSPNDPRLHAIRKVHRPPLYLAIDFRDQLDGDRRELHRLRYDHEVRSDLSHGEAALPGNRVHLHCCGMSGRNHGAE